MMGSKIIAGRIPATRIARQRARPRLANKGGRALLMKMLIEPFFFRCEIGTKD